MPRGLAAHFAQRPKCDRSKDHSMITTGQLDLGTAQIVSRATGEIIGYAFTEASTHGQLQRWLLYRDPQNAFDVQPPPATMAGWTLSDWQTNVPKLWQTGAFYVWAQADMYQYGGSYNGVTWKQIPKASALPTPTYPNVGAGSFQLDPGGKVLYLLQDQLRGLAYTLGGLRDPSSAEYWMLPAAYKPAGVGGKAGINIGAENAGSLQEFVDLANQSFGTDCRFVITGCINYRGERAPAAP
jgi:hypothetical protein